MQNIHKISRLVDYVKKLLKLTQFWNILDSYCQQITSTNEKNKLHYGEGEYDYIINVDFFLYELKINAKFLEKFLVELKANYNIEWLKMYNIEWVDILWTSHNKWDEMFYQMDLRASETLTYKPKPKPRIKIEEILKNPEKYLEALKEFDQNDIKNYDGTELETYIHEQNIMEKIIFANIFLAKILFYEKLSKQIQYLNTYSNSLKTKNFGQTANEMIPHFTKDLDLYIKKLIDIQNWVNNFLNGKTKYILDENKYLLKINTQLQAYENNNNLISQLKIPIHYINKNKKKFTVVLDLWLHKLKTLINNDFREENPSDKIYHLLREYLREYSTWKGTFDEWQKEKEKVEKKLSDYSQYGDFKIIEKLNAYTEYHLLFINELKNQINFLNEYVNNASLKEKKKIVLNQYISNLNTYLKLLQNNLKITVYDLAILRNSGKNHRFFELL